MKTTVVYCFSKVIHRLIKNKSGLQTKSDGNIQLIKEHNLTTETFNCNKNPMHIPRRKQFDRNCHIFVLVQDIVRLIVGELGVIASQTSRLRGNSEYTAYITILLDRNTIQINTRTLREIYK